LRITDESEADAIVMDPHSPELDRLLSADALRIFWAHDHHHSFHHYALFLLKANIVIPAHFHRRDHLLGFNGQVADTVPASTNQWTLGEIETFSSLPETAPRLDELYGGFGAYDVGLQRSLFVGSLMERLEWHALSIRHIQSADDPYFAQSAAERYAEWRRHKVSLAAAINQDIPIRIFDALATGQIPIIPDNIANLDWVILPEDQAQLGIERFTAGDTGSAISAWRHALANFDRLGSQGVLDRVSYFLSRHSLPCRLERMIRPTLGSAL